MVRCYGWPKLLKLLETMKSRQTTLCTAMDHAVLLPEAPRRLQLLPRTISSSDTTGSRRALPLGTTHTREAGIETFTLPAQEPCRVLMKRIS